MTQQFRHPPITERHNMHPRHSTTLRRSTTAVALLGVLTAATGCTTHRDATAISASTRDTTLTGTDPGNIVIGWGEQPSPTEITTPDPAEITAECSGQTDTLTITIDAPHGWHITARQPAQTLTIENTEQGLAATDIDTTIRYLPTLKTVDWSDPNEVDIATTTHAPPAWNGPPHRRLYVSIHVTC